VVVRTLRADEFPRAPATAPTEEGDAPGFRVLTMRSDEVLRPAQEAEQAEDTAVKTLRADDARMDTLVSARKRLERIVKWQQRGKQPAAPDPEPEPPAARSDTVRIPRDAPAAKALGRSGATRAPSPAPEPVWSQVPPELDPAGTESAVIRALYLELDRRTVPRPGLDEAPGVSRVGMAIVLAGTLALFLLGRWWLDTPAPSPAAPAPASRATRPDAIVSPGATGAPGPLPASATLAAPTYDTAAPPTTAQAPAPLPLLPVLGRDQEARLAAMLAEAPPEARRGVLTKLAGARTRTGRAALVEALLDADASVREAAARLLSGIASQGGGAEVASIAERRLGAATDDRTRILLVSSLGRAARAKAAPLLARLLAEPGPVALRTAAAAGLGATRSEEAVAPLGAALHDADPDVRAEACLSLGRLGGFESFQALVSRLEDEAAPVRAAALWALETVSGRSLGAAPEPWREMWRERLAFLEEDLEIFATAPDAERPTFLATLSQVKDPRVVRLARGELGAAHAERRLAAITALVRLGAREAIPDLAEALLDPSEEVARTAYRALAALSGATLPPRPEAWLDWWSVEGAWRM